MKASRVDPAEPIEYSADHINDTEERGLFVLQALGVLGVVDDGAIRQAGDPDWGPRQGQFPVRGSAAEFHGGRHWASIASGSQTPQRPKSNRVDLSSAF